MRGAELIAPPRFPCILGKKKPARSGLVEMHTEVIV
ncbi:hypothetical protein Q3H59_002349 [Pantoea sp. SORGH_AS 659]|jgi:hypothetical protein|nr:hypothetical protein [Pantoea sp. SORGH_AS_0659]